MTPRWLALALALAACGGEARFALRPPVTRLHDQRPFSPAPARETRYETLDALLLRPLTRLFAFDVVGEARDVNALDEVPDSSWFQNRAVTAEEIARGPCTGGTPTPPFAVRRGKLDGVTPGFFVEDARGHEYLLKIDEGVRYGQPEISTAADAIVSRLYWAVGFNVPCNVVLAVKPGDVVVRPGATRVDAAGRRRPFTSADLASVLKKATRTRGGRLRLSASRVVDGKGLGTWRAEGVRPDDPNDTIPHEDRRELRAEYFLAAWTAHWDTRRANTYDAFVQAPGGGYVKHYFIDFSDALGGTTSNTAHAEPRAGYESLVSVGTIATDIAGLGFVRRPWDDLRVDPRFPDLGYLDVEHFDPMGFYAQTPVPRWANAQPTDLAWMARRLARLDDADVRAAVRAGRLSNPREEERLVTILMGRRARILRASFARVSPLADFTLISGRLCATDLGRVTGVTPRGAASYAAEVRAGRTMRLAPVAPRLERTATGVCAVLPPHFAPQDAPADGAARYGAIDLLRFEGREKTRARAFFYDLGTRWALVGIARE